MITVMLYGGLREYGRRFDLHFNTPAEALRALLMQLPGLKNHLREGFYQVRFNGQDQSEESLVETFRQPENGVLHIVPRTQGAGRYGQIIAGVVIIALTWWTGAGGYIGASMVSAGYAMGASLILGGVAQLLTKPPSMDLESQGQKSSRNTAFSNLDNIAAQGQPVPLAYGLVYCGSRVISQGVESRRVKTDNDPVLTNPEAVDVTLDVVKTYTAGQAAIAPNGQPYKTNFADDSVRARNYIGHLQKA